VAWLELVFVACLGTTGKNKGGSKKKYSVRFMDAPGFICLDRMRILEK
jgi:hypothetical protein